VKEGRITIAGMKIPLVSLNTLIIGSGAAALNAAVRLHERGQRDIALATEEFGGGTSNKAGSDKQTYYKLSLAGDRPDSPLEMARDLFKGGCMHGDIALCEAQGSAEAFFHLVGLGVPFPHDRFGAYVGYKTDHDPRQRATSAGPLTSRLMFERLADVVKTKDIHVFDGHQVIALLTEGGEKEKKVIGAVALDKRKGRRRPAFVVFNAVNIVLGTGGPAGIYQTSVYPESQTGAHGLAFEIGAIGHNLTESQYGLASLKFRWNLSGTYQQVIPRYLSTDRAGRDEREFLNDYFPDMGTLATAIFLKGYQWPFDPRKVAGHGSSLIDLLVHQETVIKGRRVFLDYRRNPAGAGALQRFSFDRLSPEAFAYLENSGALLPTPIERLIKMNPPAIAVFKDHGIDLERENLEIAVCAQHNNGGLKSGIWWESNIRHLFPVGEVNGTHGVRRPGGSALNAGQVGGLRAAAFIAGRCAGRPSKKDVFLAAAEPQIRRTIETARKMLGGKTATAAAPAKAADEFRRRMSAHGAQIRDPGAMDTAVSEAWSQWAKVKRNLKVPGPEFLPQAFKILDLCLTHALYLEAIREYIDKGGRSRGSYLVLDPNGEKPCPRVKGRAFGSPLARGLYARASTAEVDPRAMPGAPAAVDDRWTFSLAGPRDFVSRKILEISLDERMNVRKEWVDIRPIPPAGAWFETVWNDFRNDRILERPGEEHD